MFERVWIGANSDILLADNFAQTAAVNIALRLMGRITELVENWYSYVYDGTLRQINDGGNDMYDVGNRVRIHACLLRNTSDILPILPNLQ